jgi:hypothetical protein
VLISGDSDLHAWLAVCVLSLQGQSGGLHEVPRGWTPAGEVEASGLQRQILQKLDAAGANGVVEGDFGDLSQELPGAMVAALTLLSMRGVIEQRGGRWRRVLGAVLRSRP